MSRGDYLLGKGSYMQSKQIIVALVVMNVALLLLQVAHGRPNPITDAPNLRVRSLELVDDQGRVRAELKTYPAQPDLKMPDGTTGYPEAVQLRLITSQGKPNVKLVATEDGAASSMVGEKGYVQVMSRSHEDPFVKIVTKDKREKSLQP
jgi:hypothetical protein